MDEREKIINFLNYTDKWLENVLDERIFVFLFPVHRDILPLAHKAYHEVHERLVLVIEHIKKQDEKEFAENLVRNGLTGIQWDLKHEIVQIHEKEASRRIEEAIFKYEDRLGAKKNYQRRTLKRILKKLFDAIDSILDSVIQSGTPVHFLKEIKDSLSTLFM